METKRKFNRNTFILTDKKAPRRWIEHLTLWSSVIRSPNWAILAPNPPPLLHSFSHLHLDNHQISFYSFTTLIHNLLYIINSYKYSSDSLHTIIILYSIQYSQTIFLSTSSFQKIKMKENWNRFWGLLDTK